MSKESDIQSESNLEAREIMGTLAVVAVYVLIIAGVIHWLYGYPGRAVSPSTTGQGNDTSVHYWIARNSGTSPCYIVDEKPADTSIIIVGTKDYSTREDAYKDMTVLCKPLP